MSDEKNVSTEETEEIEVVEVTEKAADSKPSASKVEKRTKRRGSSRVAKWFRELRSELKKVTWSSRSQLINHTWVVLVVMAVSGIAIWGFDLVAGLAIQTLITLVG